MFSLLTIITFIIYFRCLIKRECFLHVPTLFALAYLFFLIPQILAFNILGLGRNILNSDAYTLTLVYAIICLVASYLGWESGHFKDFHIFLQLFNKQINKKSLLIIMIFTSVISNIAAFKFIALSKAGEFEYVNGQQLTGIGTKFVFIANLFYLPYSFFISQAINNSKIKNVFFLILISLLTYQRIFEGGRRGPLASLFIPVLCMLYFNKSIVFSRIFILLSILAPLVLIPALSEYRFSFWELAYQNQFNVADILSIIKSYFTQDYPYDFINAINIVDFTDRNTKFGLGTGFLNDLVNGFIPAQFLGDSFKDSLYIKISPISYLKNSDLSFYFDYKIGTTQTGLGNTFAEFGLLGSICFFIQAKLMRTFWDSAITGNLYSMIAYCYLTTPVFLSVTHGFYTFINYCFIYFLFTFGLTLINRLNLKYEA